MTDDFAETETETAPEIQVRRNVALAGTISCLAAVLAIAFAVRAFGGGTTLDWLSLGVTLIVALVHLAAILDARAPLLVVDAQGVRVRKGATWQGIAWPEIDCLEHLPRRGLFRDGHVLVAGYDDQQLIVPLTLATRVVGADDQTLSDALAALAAGRADVVEVVPGLDDPGEDEPQDADDSSPSGWSDDDPTAERPIVTDDVAPEQPEHPEQPGRPERPDAERQEATTTAVEEPTAVVEPIVPQRPTVYSARVEYPSAREHHLRERDDTPEPATAVTPGVEDTTTVVLEDLEVRPANNPVIGPQVKAARERLRLSVDQLSERTRIRPHVIEAIEVDDFAPCGGDFYARGHLRTLARVLGIDVTGLIVTYDENYADAPVDPRRVFESELATGVGGSIRSTRGGRNWSVMVAAVMAAVLVWSLASLLMSNPQPVGDTPVLNQSGGIVHKEDQKAATVTLVLTAAGGGAQVQVRDGGGDVVFDGQLAFGQSSELDLTAPIRITSSDGSVTYAMNGEKAAPLGETGEEVNKTLVAP
ncbi:hypothetical protein FXB39_00360 [Nocardioides sp. BGMRC 2183]|nr:hypothetical protein FXB39_00360 [Nocardioides sp. BGMRC 2183]